MADEVQSGSGDGAGGGAAPQESSAKNMVLRVVAVLGAIGSILAMITHGLGMFDRFSGANDEVPEAVVTLQRQIISDLEGDGDGPVPVDCLPAEESELESLRGPASLLKGGAAASKRPQDDDALKALAGRVDDNPSNAIFWALLSKAQLQSGEASAEVIKNAQIAAGLCGTWALPQNLVGSAYFADAKGNEAEVAWRSALGLAPDYAAPRFNLALLAVKKQAWQEAVKQLDKLLEKHKHHKSAHLLRAQSHLGLGALKEAEADARGAIERDGSNANAHVILGQALGQQGKVEDGKAAFCKARALGHPAGAKLCPDPAP